MKQLFFFALRKQKIKHSITISSGKSSSSSMQLLLFVVRKVSHVDHESMMTSGLVDWCFSRRTHRRGRMITCRARAARCTRKPSPRPLPGWHFPKPASKFSLPMAVTHINVPNRYSRQSRDIHVHWQLYGPSYTIFIWRKSDITYNTGTLQYNTIIQISFPSISFSLFVSYLRVSRIIKYIKLFCDTGKTYFIHIYYITTYLWERIYIYISPSHLDLFNL